MGNNVDFVTLYINHTGICENFSSNTTLLNGLLKNKEPQHVPVNEVFYNSEFPDFIHIWLKGEKNNFSEKMVEDGFSIYLISIQPVKINTIVAVITIRISPATKHINQLKYNFGAALDKSNVGLWVWPDSNSGKSWWSESFFNLLGYADNELEPGMTSFMKLIHPDQLDEFIKSMSVFSAKRDKFIDAEETYREVKLRTKSGMYKDLLFSAKAIKKDATLGFSGTVVDIHKLKITEKKLIESDSRLQLALEATDGWVFEWDINNDIYFLSNIHLKISGYEKGDVSITRDVWLDLIHPEDRISLLEALQKHIRDKSPYMEAEFRVKSISGEDIWILERGKICEEDQHGNVTKYIGTHINITERKNIELQLVQRDEELKMSMEAGNMGTWSWNVKTNEVLWSDHVLKIFGLQKQQFKGDYESYLNLIPFEERELITTTLEKVLTEKQNDFSYEHSIYLPDGSKRILYCKGKLYKDSKGIPSRMTGVVLDITEESELRVLLGQTKERYKSVIEAMSEGVIIIDLDGRIIDHNKAAVVIIGYENEILIGNDLSFGPGEAIREDLSSFPMKEFPGIKTLHTGLPYKNITLGWIKPSKDMIWLSINSEPVIDEFGRQVAVVCSYSDVTERYNSLNDLKIKNRQLEDFAHITSHNLRSPISNLSILLDYFEAATEETEKKEYLSNLKHVSDNLLSTIQVLAESLKIQRDFVDDECEIAFKEIFDNVVRLLSGQVQEAGVQFHVDFSFCSQIYYSPTYLQSIFINLISNAIKYRSYNRTAIVKVEAYKTDTGKAVLKVADNGIGIDLAKNKHKIFGLYKTFHSNKDSRGVGLFMTKRQVEALGGVIEVESEINVGTTFTIVF
jgi:PAS domain S-box-containing protein